MTRAQDRALRDICASDVCATCVLGCCGVAVRDDAPRTHGVARQVRSWPSGLLRCVCRFCELRLDSSSWLNWSRTDCSTEGNRVPARHPRTRSERTTFIGFAQREPARSFSKEASQCAPDSVLASERRGSAASGRRGRSAPASQAFLRCRWRRTAGAASGSASDHEAGGGSCARDTAPLPRCLIRVNVFAQTLRALELSTPHPRSSGADIATNATAAP